MKPLIIIICWSIVIGCSIPNNTPITPTTTNSTFDSTKATLLKSGKFVGLDGPTTGTAKVYDQLGTKYIVFDPFQSNNGPDLYVYLSKDVNAADYIRISKLQAISGRQIYSVPSGTTIADYNYVHIWCQKYSVDFARAEIK